MKYGIKVTISFIIALSLLSVFFFFYRYTDVKQGLRNGATDFSWQPNQWANTMEEGIAFMQGDPGGYNNSKEIYLKAQSHVDNLLVGSSHMEAVQIPQNGNVSSLLNEMMPDKVTYNIGMSEHNIYRCAANIADAYEIYKPGDFIIMETRTVNLNINLMRQVIGDTFESKIEPEGGVVYLIQRVPAIRVIGLKIKTWWNVGNAHIDDANLKPINDFSSETVFYDDYDIEYADTVRAFVKKIRSEVPDSCKILIFYQPLTEINEAGNYTQQRDAEARKIFERACHENNIFYLDLTDDFRKLYESKHILAHGFSNTAIGSGHLNKYGHQAIANRIYQFMIEAEYKNHEYK